MFGNRRSYNDIFRAFDEMFSQFDSLQGEWKTQTRVSEDGTTRITSYYYGNKDDKSPNSGIQGLRSQLETAIENEDFEKAVELRDKIKNLESNQKEIEKLELELKQSVKDQNFEKSIEIRDQLKKLK
jgi:protein-arginine kinase activator protein McsA